MIKETFNVEGMTCNNCVKHIEDALKTRVNHVKANFNKGIVEVEYDSSKISRKEVISKIQEQGYDVVENKEKKNSNYFGWVVVMGSLLLLAYFLYGYLDSMNLSFPEMGQKTSLFFLFLIGLLTGFHCVSMCGGFVISYSTKNAQKGHKGLKQHLVYGVSKTLSYTIIGGIFGLVGSIFFFSPALRGTIAILAGIFMIFFALSMFGIKFFRKFQFNPKFLMKVSTKKHEGVYFGPMMTGLANGLFIACGPLQAMYIYAAGTGSVLSGAISLMAFGLGTLPVMIGFGGMANVISHKNTRKILKISGVIVLILGLIMINRGLSLTGSGYDVKSILANVNTNGLNSQAMIDSDGYQVIEMDVISSGYSPDTFTLKRGVPVKWVIDGKELTGCNGAIQVPSLDIAFDVKEGKQTIEFTPEKTGVISWSCWMGMIPGTFIVTEDGIANQEQIKSTTQAQLVGICGASVGGCGCGGY